MKQENDKNVDCTNCVQRKACHWHSGTDTRGIADLLGVILQLWLQPSLKQIWPVFFVL